MAKGGNGKGGSPQGGGSQITGTNGNDILSDEGVAVILAGGKGDDLYLVSDPGTVVEESRPGGTDEVRTALDWRLGAWVENLTLTGTTNATGEGNELDNVLLGNDGANLLLGMDGNDLLDGGAGDDVLDGGTGDDTLIGGAGNDRAVFAGLSTDYELRREGDQIWVIRGAERDILAGIETLSFADVDIDAASIGAPASAPVAVADSASGTEDQALTVAVLLNDLGNGLEIAQALNGAKGRVTVNVDNTVTYTPDANANGTDSFTYTVRDAAGQTASTTVTLTIASVNDAPDAVADAFAVAVGQTLSGAVLANDSDPDGDLLSVSDYQAVSAGGGSVSMAADGSFTYAAAAGFTGVDSFAYTAADGNGGFSAATVTVTVQDTAVPYYVEGLTYAEDWRRMNWPDQKGSAVEVTYAFLTEVPGYYGTSIDPTSFDAFTSQQQQVTRDALAMIESFTGITFTETTSDLAGMTFGTYSYGGAGSASLPFGDGVGAKASDVWLGAEYAGDVFTVGSDVYYTLLHEIGHALGLRHADLPPAEETHQYTLMASYAYPTIGGAPDEYRLYDIAALQYLYGANAAHAAGNDVYDAAMLVGETEVIWDGGGRDAIDLSGSPYAVRIDLGEGAFSTAHATGSNNIAIAYGTVIEDAVGSAGADVIVGNAVANRIEGGGGGDTLSGGAGADSFVFATGWGADRITDFARGADLLDFSGSGLGFADLSVTTVAEGTQVAHAGDTVLLVGVDALDASDFLFGTA